MPDAYHLIGRYAVKGGKVTLTLRLSRGGEKAEPFTVTGEEARPDELAAKIAREVEKRLAKVEEKK